MNRLTLQELKKVLPRLRTNVLLKNYTTFHIGGPAKYFFEARTKNDLVKAIEIARQYNLPFFILGGGSNLLVSDEGYDGLVIKCQMSNVKCQIKSKYQMSKIYIEAGTKLSDLVKTSLEKSLTGLEWAAGIPGTVGAAICGNSGAFSQSMSDIVKKVNVLNIGNEKNKKTKNYVLEFQTFSNKDCKFVYRNSTFKEHLHFIILSAEIQLKRAEKEKVREAVNKYLRYRRVHQPLNFFSAGSIFKNKKIGPENKELLEKFPALRKFSQAGIIPAGYLIDKSGAKGKRVGGAQISERHANFIVNLEDATAQDVMGLIKFAKSKVKEVFGIELEEEIRSIGF